MVLLDGSVAHVVAGGVAGTTGAVITSPLEIVKTRLQGSVNTWNEPAGIQRYRKTLKIFPGLQANASSMIYQPLMAPCYSQSAFDHKLVEPSKNLSLSQCLRHIYRTEGIRALYKGLSMTLLGVMPSRAVYFGTYFNGQEMFSTVQPKGSHANVIMAAAFASFVSSTSTNPIWMVKTRLQLDQSHSAKPLTVVRCVKEIWRQSGFLGFYKGIQASYVGIAETALHFVLYEDLKRRLIQLSRGAAASQRGVNRVDEVLFCSVASMCSKSTATVVCYPHEVLRTRLRQEGGKYTGLCRTLRLVLQEEGPRALYRGLLTHFARQIPNTCIVLTVYEAILHFLRARNMLAA